MYCHGGNEKNPDLLQEAIHDFDLVIALRFFLSGLK